MAVEPVVLTLPTRLLRRINSMFAMIERTKRNEGQAAKPVARLLDSTGPTDKQ